MTAMDNIEAARLAHILCRAAAVEVNEDTTIDQVLNAFGKAIGAYIGTCAFIDRELMIEAMLLIVNKAALSATEKFCRDHGFEPRKMQ